MDNTLLNTFLSRLEYVHTFDMEHNSYGDFRDKIYKTTFNDLNIVVSFSNKTGRSEKFGKIIIKDKNNHELFDIAFNNYIDSLNYKYSEVLVGNIITKDSEAINKLFEKVKLDEFIAQELQSMQTIVDDIRHQKSNHSLNLYYCTTQDILDFSMQKNNINKPHNKEDFNKDHLYQLIDEIDSYYKSVGTCFYEKSYSTSSVDELRSHKEKFNNVEINHSVYISDRFSDKNRSFLHTITIAEPVQGILFDLEIRSRSSGSKEHNYDIRVRSQSPFDELTINNIITSFDIDEYLKKTLNNLQVLNEAQQVKDNIKTQLSTYLCDMKVSSIVELDLASPIKQPTIDTNNPITINDTKIWVNKYNELHRKDGPAIENYQGKDYWFTNDKPSIPMEKNAIVEKCPDPVDNNTIDSNIQKETATEKKKAISLIQRMKNKLFSSNRIEHKNTM